MPSKSPAQASKPYRRPGGVSWASLNAHVRPYGKNNHVHAWKQIGLFMVGCNKCGQMKEG